MVILLTTVLLIPVKEHDVTKDATVGLESASSVVLCSFISRPGAMICVLYLIQIGPKRELYNI